MGLSQAGWRGLFFGPLLDLIQVLGWDCDRNHFEKAIVLDFAPFGKVIW